MRYGGQWLHSRRRRRSVSALGLLGHGGRGPPESASRVVAAGRVGTLNPADDVTTNRIARGPDPGGVRSMATTLPDQPDAWTATRCHCCGLAATAGSITTPRGSLLIGCQALG